MFVPKWSRPEVTRPCGLLGENEKTDTFEDAAARAMPVAAETPAIAKARTTAGRLHRFVYAR